MALWFWNEFGMRCVDGIRSATSFTKDDQTSFLVRKVEVDAIQDMIPFLEEHYAHFMKAPTFMPKSTSDLLGQMKRKMAAEDFQLWIAYDGETPLGYMHIGPEAETFVSEHGSVMNVNGAHVAKEYRGNGVADEILNCILKWLQKEGYPLCGVDYEAINCVASNYWQRYFESYTYSLVRRVDERVLLE